MIIDCNVISKNILDEVKKDVEILMSNNIEPTLVLIRVEGDDASKVYVNNKIKKCEEVNIRSILIEFPNSTTQEYLLNLIDSLNKDSDIHGILVQLPLPKHIDKDIIINSIDPSKDVDMLNKKSQYINTNMAPCTPTGIMQIFNKLKINLEGIKVLIINRSELVGRPLVDLLLKENACPIIAHSKISKETINSLIANSDIIITGTGVPNFITKELLKSIQHNQIIIDVSMNRDNDGKLCGDVEKSAYDLPNKIITPVPKGVGLTTVACLLENTIKLIDNKYV